MDEADLSTDATEDRTRDPQPAERPRVPRTEIRNWLSILVILVWIGLLVALATNGWDELRHAASTQMVLLLICLAFVVAILAIHVVDWGKWWSVAKSGKATSAAIAMALAILIPLIAIARVEEKRDLETATVFLFAGLLCAWFAKSVLGLTDSPFYIAILIIPLIAYLALTGRLSVVELPGGTKLELGKIADDQAKPGAAYLLAQARTAKSSGSDNCANTIAGSFAPPAEGQTAFLIPTQFARTIDPAAMLDYFVRYPALRYFVVVDANCRFIGFGKVDALKTIIVMNVGSPAGAGQTVNGKSFFDDVSRSTSQSFGGLARYPGFSNDTFEGNPTIAQALNAFDARNVDALAVVEPETRRFIGILDRDQLANQIFLTLLEVPTPTPQPTPGGGQR